MTISTLRTRLTGLSFWRKMPTLWATAAVAAVAVITFGLIPFSGPDGVVETLHRTQHILIFLAAITAVSELCSRAGLFDVLGSFIGSVAKGRTWLMYVGVACVGMITTSLMSLDTTAVLLTPVAVRMALNSGAAAMPFALATIWLANAGSLLLPISNLTNLLAVDRLGLTPGGFLLFMWAPALIAAVLPVVLIFLVYRRQLTARCAPPGPSKPNDRLLVLVCGLVTLAMLPAIMAGWPIDLIAVAAMIALVISFILRGGREHLGLHLLPWRILILTVALFIVIGAVSHSGGRAAAEHVLGQGSGLGSLLRTAAVSAIAANLFNNLPAYILVESAVPDGQRQQLLAVLIGVNVGPGILAHGSLATLLWWERCRAEGLAVPWTTFTIFGLIAVPFTIFSSVLVSWLMA